MKVICFVSVDDIADQVVTEEISLKSAQPTAKKSKVKMYAMYMYSLQTMNIIATNVLQYLNNGSIFMYNVPKREGLIL